MVRLLLAASFLVSLSAQATPNVGDFAQFDSTFTLNGQTIQADAQQEIVQFDSINSKYLEKQTVTITGRTPEVTEEWKAADDYLDDNTIDMILANCAAAGGTPQDIQVPAGAFSTCAMNFDNDESQGTVWIAKVPFGLAQVVTTQKSNGLVMTMGLRSYR